MKYILALAFIALASAAVTGVYENKLGQEVDYSLLPEDDKMIGFLWKDFKIPYSEKVTKAMVFISTTKNFLGKWTGA